MDFDFQWQCCKCGHQMDGVLSYPPDKCSECGREHFMDSLIAMEEEAKNRTINKHDEYLEELENE